MSKDFNPQKASIFRITHRDNLRWIFANGLHCANSGQADPNFVVIGNPDLIDKRGRRALPPPGEGVLGDYVPFYFTPFSPMMLNIKTGWRGIAQRGNEEIAILVSSVWRLRGLGVPFVFSDRHAYLQAAQFHDDPARLDQIDWDLLQRRDFQRDANDPEKVERYEAEALARRHVPVDALLSVACFNESSRKRIEDDAKVAAVNVRIRVKPEWYFQ